MMFRGWYAAVCVCRVLEDSDVDVYLSAIAEKDWFSTFYKVWDLLGWIFVHIEPPLIVVLLGLMVMDRLLLSETHICMTISMW